MFKTLMTASMMILTLAACSFDKNSSSNTDRQAREYANEKARQEPLVGTYKGQFTNTNMSQDVEVVISIEPRAEGPEVNGKKSVIAVLVADYKKISPVAPGYKFTIAYLDKTGDVTFTNEKKDSPNSPLGDDDFESIVTTLSADKKILSGHARNKFGDAGRIELVRVTPVPPVDGKPGEPAPTPIPGDQTGQDYYDRLAAQYREIAGNYEGAVRKKDGTCYPAKIEIGVQMIPNGKLSIPEFYGFYRRPDMTSEGMTLKLENFQYQADVKPKRLVVYGVPWKYLGSPFKATFQGRLENGRYIGSWSSNANGFEGDFTLKFTPELTGQEELAAAWPTLPEQGPIPTPKPTPDAELTCGK